MSFVVRLQRGTQPKVMKFLTPYESIKLGPLRSLRSRTDFDSVKKRVRYDKFQKQLMPVEESQENQCLQSHEEDEDKEELKLIRQVKQFKANTAGVENYHCGSYFLFENRPDVVSEPSIQNGDVRLTRISGNYIIPFNP